MIINSIADGQVTSNDLVEFNFRPISYSIKGGGKTISGQVQAKTYESVDVSGLGSGPFEVSLGYVNHSWQAKPVTVDSPDALCTFWMAFPAGPNGPVTFVYNKGK